MWQTLAPELITEIILHCYFPEWELRPLEPYLFPWYLGHICRAWRSVFVSTPQFWSNPAFDTSSHPTFDTSYFTRNKTSFQHAVSITKLCMERSRDHLLSFKFSMEIYPSPLQPTLIPCCHEILETLVRHSTRWQDVHLHLSPSELQVLYAAKNRLPALRSIRLAVTSGLVDQDALVIDPTFSDLFIHTPRLRRINLSYPSYDCPFWKIDWSLITVVHYNHPRSPQAFISFLRQTTAIEEVVLYKAFDIEIQPHAIRPVTLPSLKVLHVVTIDALSLFVTPSLEKLSIAQHDVYPVGSTRLMLESVMFNFFRPLHHLKDLALFTEEDEQSIAMIMGKMPEVHRLFLRSNTAITASRTGRRLETLSQCSQARYFREVTYGAQRFEGNELEEVSAVITSWTRQKSAVKGIGSFENLTHFYLETVEADLPEPCLHSLKHHFNEHGISFSKKFNTKHELF